LFLKRFYVLINIISSKVRKRITNNKSSKTKRTQDYERKLLPAKDCSDENKMLLAAGSQRSKRDFEKEIHQRSVSSCGHNNEKVNENNIPVPEVNMLKRIIMNEPLRLIVI
jgi:hypothetical protein